MRDITELLRYHSADEAKRLFARALDIAEKNPQATWLEFQNELRIGTEEAYLIQDMLADFLRVRPRMSNHWVRCGRTYVLNNPSPSLFEMRDRLRMGEQTVFQIAVELQKRHIIRIGIDFSFERLKMSTEDDLIWQVKQVAKKYRGRCEPELLMRRMYVDEETATRLSAHGANVLGLRPQRWRQ